MYTYMASPSVEPVVWGICNELLLGSYGHVINTLVSLEHLFSTPWKGRLLRENPQPISHRITYLYGHDMAQGRIQEYTLDASLL